MVVVSTTTTTSEVGDEVSAFVSSTMVCVGVMVVVEMEFLVMVGCDVRVGVLPLLLSILVLQSFHPPLVSSDNFHAGDGLSR